ncbi:MAG: SDR family oxidoreductase [Rhodothermales bacterium]
MEHQTPNAQKQTVLITGAGGAMAEAVNAAFDEAGWKLALFGHSEGDLQRLRARYPDALVYAVDLTDEAATRTFIEEVHRQAGSIDAVLNIAGGFAMQPADKATREDYERLFARNFITLFNTTRAVLPIMKAQGSGFILGVSAAAAEGGGGGMSLYAASKAAVTAYLKSLHAELADDGLRVSTLYPMGTVDTPANRTSMPDADPSAWIAPSELAESMLYLASRSRQGHIRELKVYAPGSD